MDDECIKALLEKVLVAIEVMKIELSGEIRQLREEVQVVKADVKQLQVEMQIVKADVKQLQVEMQIVKADMKQFREELQVVKTDVIEIKYRVGSNYLKLSGKIELVTDMLSAHRDDTEAHGHANCKTG